ncbi:MAG: hypothetical protein ACKOYK_01125 [Cyanobium sp.]
MGTLSIRQVPAALPVTLDDLFTRLVKKLAKKEERKRSGEALRVWNFGMQRASSAPEAGLKTAR